MEDQIIVRNPASDLRHDVVRLELVSLKFCWKWPSFIHVYIYMRFLEQALWWSSPNSVHLWMILQTQTQWCLFFWPLRNSTTGTMQQWWLFWQLSRTERNGKPFLLSIGCVSGLGMICVLALFKLVTWIHKWSCSQKRASNAGWKFTLYAM